MIELAKMAAEVVETAKDIPNLKPGDLTPPDFKDGPDWGRNSDSIPDIRDQKLEPPVFSDQPTWGDGQVFDKTVGKGINLRNNELTEAVDLNEEKSPKDQIGSSGEKLNSQERSQNNISEDKVQNDYRAEADPSGNSNDNKIRVINEKLEGQTHPDTGVPYVRKTVEDDKGNPVDGVFPVFDSKFDAKLSDEFLLETDGKQKMECNKQLEQYCEKNPEEAKQKFTQEQLEDIMAGKTPEGFLWHHNEEKGLMQLVDAEVHSFSRHTGGKVIWGGGVENRV